MKRFILIICSAACVFLMGCSNASVEPADNGQPSAPATEEPAVLISSQENSAEPVATATPVPRATAGENEDVAYKSDSVEVVYNDPEDGKTYTESVDISENSGVDAALNAVNELVLKGKFGDIGFNSVVRTGDNIFIDFDQSVYNLAKNPLEEYPALEAIADAYLNNVEGINRVYITVNGGGYSSMNIEYDVDEPFKTK